MSELRAGLSCRAGETQISPLCEKAGAAATDYVLAAILVLITTYTFMYGDADQRRIALIISLASGLCRPPLLIFSLSLATSLDIVGSHFFTPIRVSIIFAAIALPPRLKHILERVSGEHLIALTYLWIFGMWCLLCIYIRADWGGLEDVIMIFGYAAACLFLLAIIKDKRSVSTFVWLGLLPTVISTISASLHLRPVNSHEYLATQIGLRYRGILHDPNYLSSILLVGFTICLASIGAKKGVLSKTIYLAVSAAFFFALWAPQSRGGIYTAAFCLAIFILSQAGSAIRNGKLGNLLLVVLMGVVVVLFFTTHTHSRVFNAVREQGFSLVRHVNELAVEPILRNPVFGEGEAPFVRLYGAPHDTLLSIGLRYGIPGMVLMLGGLFYCFYNLWKHRKGESMAIFLPLLAINMVLCSFSAPGHKLFWFCLVSGMVFRQTGRNGEINGGKTPMAAHS